MKKETRNKLDKAQQSVTTENSIIYFGKRWKGKRVSEIINKDPGWLSWAANEGILLFDDDTYIAIQKAVELLHSNITYRED